MASKYVISDEELGDRIAAMHRETPRRTYDEQAAPARQKKKAPHRQASDPLFWFALTP